MIDSNRPSTDDPARDERSSVGATTLLDRVLERVVPRVRAVEPESAWLQPVTDGVWFHERALGGERGPKLPTRMGVVRLSDGGLWIWSPLPAVPALVEALSTLGRVRAVVAPSTFHHLWTASFAATCDARAEIWCAPAVAAKDPSLRAARVLHDDATPTWAEEFEWVGVGPLGAFCEVLLFHVRSRTLFVADLAFNLVDLPRAIDRWYWSLYGSYGRLEPSFLLRRFLRRDPARVRAALRRVAEWPIQRIFVSHGQIVEDHAQAALSEAFGRWML